MDHVKLPADWLSRQIASTQEEVAGWPEWLRGVSNKEGIKRMDDERKAYLEVWFGNGGSKSATRRWDMPDLPRIGDAIDGLFYAEVTNVRFVLPERIVCIHAISPRVNELQWQIMAKTLQAYGWKVAPT